jgi:hypothetical protein
MAEAVLSRSLGGSIKVSFSMLAYSEGQETKVLVSPRATYLRFQPTSMKDRHRMHMLTR